MGALRIDRRWCVLPKGQAQLACGQRAFGITAMVDGPLQLDPVQPRRSVLETDHGHVAFGLRAVAQRRRRRVRGRLRGYASWGTHDPKNLSVHSGKGNLLVT